MSREVDLGQIVPNIQVGATTTGLPSTPASVENVGTDLNPIFNFTIPKGNTGATPNIQIGTVQTGDTSEVTRTGTNENPILNFTLEKGDTGNGIASITKTSTSGLVDTYTITFTNGQTTTYQITNGANGSVVDVQVDGTSVVDNGIANIIGLTEMKQELEDMYNLLPKVQGTGETITLNNTVAGKMLVDLKGNTSQEGTPTPDAPQDIHVVSGDNSIEVVGKNLFNPNVATNNCTVNNGFITITSNYADVYIEGAFAYNEANKFLTLPSGSYYMKSTNPNVRITFYGTGALDTDGTQPRTLTEETKFGGIRVRSIDGTSLQNVSFGLMLATDNSSFEPYQSASYPINLGDIELCKIGVRQDSIVKDNGKWYLNKQIGKVVLNGSEDWQGGTSSSGNVDYTYFYTDAYDNLILPNSLNSYCDKLTSLIGTAMVASTFVNTDTIGVGANSTNRIRLMFLTNRLSEQSTTAFKTWLSTHNTTVYYVLSTPTYTEITDSTLLSQLDTIKRSYDEQTNITQVNNDLPFILDATALKQLTQ